MTTKVMAVDPGNVTGVAIHTFPGKTMPRTYEVDPLDAPALVEIHTPSVVVCESFVPRPGAKTWQPEALYTIGAVRYVAQAILHAAFVLQTPADAKRFSTNDKLKKLSWRAPSKGGHADDALRHLLLYAVRAGLIDAEDLL